MSDNASVHPPGFLADPTRFMFFTGKGGVGKTSIACAVALALADSGKSVLIVSTDPASNLDEILDVPLGNLPVAVPGAERLQVLNIDPTAAADAYRARVLAQMGPDASEQDRNEVREQLSGACTTEIAAFDEFVGHLAGDDGGYDHIVFDTAPTGHTLRLLSLPKAWSGFLEVNDARRLLPGAAFRAQDARSALQNGYGDAQRSVIDDHHPRSSTRNQRSHRGGANLGGASNARSLEPASGRERRVPRQRPIGRDGCVAGRPG